jgi:rhodanese-related sulfurtransferase
VSAAAGSAQSRVGDSARRPTRGRVALGHLQGAVNIPLGKLKKRLAELDPDKEIVAYCRGPYCVLSYEAVATLRRRGFNVRRLEDGFPECRAAGLPVETGLAK